MRDEDFDESRRLAPVWRRIIILLAVIAAVPVVLWSITAFVRAYVAAPKAPIYRPVTASASLPDPTTEVTPSSALARALAPLARSAQSPQVSPPLLQPPIVEAKATTSDAGGLPPVNDPPLQLVAPAAAAPTDPAAPGRDTAADAASAIATDDAVPASLPRTMTAAPAQIVDEDVPAGEPLAGPVPLPPHRPRVFAMVPSAIPVPRPRPVDTGEAVAPADVSLSARDYMH